MPSQSIPLQCLVTGGAGFIGSHMVDHLLRQGHQVLAVDNLSTGRMEFLKDAQNLPGFEFRKIDLFQERDLLNRAMAGKDLVIHFAANADVRFGTDHPERDLQQNTQVTAHVLEAMRLHGVKRIAFASTGSVYGEPEVFPTPENAPFPLQTSLYGASKLAAEGMISAYCSGYGFHGYIFRFVSVLGERYSHGHVFDFYKQLRQDPTRLKILGDGTQTKSYMYIEDCVQGVWRGVERGRDGVNVYNLGRDEVVQVNDSVATICRTLGLKPKLEYTGGKRGWIGDSPMIHLDVRKMKGLGWEAATGIRQGLEKTVGYLRENPWLLERA